MNLRLQQLIVDSNGGARALTVQTTAVWRRLITTVGLVGAVLVLRIGPVGIAIAAGIIVLALLMSFFSNTLVIDDSAKHLLLRSGIGPLQATTTIPFDSIKMVAISDGGTARWVGAGTNGSSIHARPVYSLAVEIVGKKHAKVLLAGIPKAQLVDEACELARVCGKNVFIPSALQPSDSP